MDLLLARGGDPSMRAYGGCSPAAAAAASGHCGLAARFTFHERGGERTQDHGRKRERQESCGNGVASSPLPSSSPALSALAWALRALAMMRLPTRIPHPALFPGRRVSGRAAAVQEPPMILE